MEEGEWRMEDGRWRKEMLCYDSDIKADVEKVVTRSRATSRQKKLAAAVAVR